MATNKRLIEIYNMMKDGVLILRPTFQRNLVWNDRHKEKFIDTILRGLPFPEVYFADGEINLETKQNTTVVVDGQQRLSTILKYVNGELKLRNIPIFNNLTPNEQTDFLNYKIVIRDLGKISDEEVKEIFSRINSVRYALNAVELENALYEGEFISTAKEIQQEVSLELTDIFSKSEFARMKDLEFILLVMSTIELGGYFHRSKEVENMIKRFDDEYQNKDNIKGLLVIAFKLIQDLKLESDSLWLRTSSFFSLIIELSKFIMIHHEPKVDSLKEILISLEKSILNNKNSGNNDDYSNFYNYVFQDTASKTARIERGAVIEKHLMSLL